MKNNFQVPTPLNIVEEILNYAGYVTNLYGKKALENSCGEGNFLVIIVKRYIDDCVKNNIGIDTIKKGLENDIVAYDIDSEKVIICKRRLDELARKYGIISVSWNIQTKDFLTENVAPIYDFIIGNPPYRTYHDLSTYERDFLKSNFITCRKGRYDYFYAFIERSLKMLKLGGKLFYLIPFSLYRNKSADIVRSLLIDKLSLIVDYSGFKIFDNATITSTLIGYEAGKNQQNYVYIKPFHKIKKILNKNTFGKLWFFEQTKKKKFRFGDFFSVKNSVATQCNNAYIIYAKYEDEHYVYTQSGEVLERKLVKKAISARSGKSPFSKDIRIIFPYILESGEIIHLSDYELETFFPNVINHLKKYKNELSKRTASKGIKWFEYGRSQGLTHIGQKKLVIPMVITKKTTVLEAEEDVIPYAGYVISSISRFDLYVAKKILESAEFLSYVKAHGTPTTSTSYRISTREIENYTFN